MRTQSFRGDKWEWLMVEDTSEQELSSLPSLPKDCSSWLQSLQKEQNVNLEMETTEKEKESLWGSLIYYQNIEERDKQTILHYHLSRNRLITSQVDESFFDKLSEQHLLKKMQHASNAIEGFMILIGEIVASFLHAIDAFEDRMHDLLWRIRVKNDDKVLNRIIENQHEILVWNNLIIPVIEIREAIQEAFGDEVSDGPHYQRTCRRIQRCRKIIQEYDEEVGKLIGLESVISSHRGNEIVKTLTVITMLFTPVAAWGALWGMNFELMPELKWRYGYIASLVVILLSTWGLYYYLKRKNWIGSVLKSPKDKKF